MAGIDSHVTGIDDMIKNVCHCRKKIKIWKVENNEGVFFRKKSEKVKGESLGLHYHRIVSLICSANGKQRWDFRVVVLICKLVIFFC